ncbi:hypothetical protein ACLOJK_027401 [Asimina triloba]
MRSRSGMQLPMGFRFGLRLPLMSFEMGCRCWPPLLKKRLPNLVCIARRHRISLDFMEEDDGCLWLPVSYLVVAEPDPSSPLCGRSFKWLRLANRSPSAGGFAGSHDRLLGGRWWSIKADVSALFKHFKIDLRKETPLKTTKYDIIGESTLKRMRYRRAVEGKWVLPGEEHQQE